MSFSLATNSITSALTMLVALDSNNTTIKDFVSGQTVVEEGSIQLATTDATWGGTTGLRWFRPSGEIRLATGHTVPYNAASGMGALLIQVYSAGSIGGADSILADSSAGVGVLSAGGAPIHFFSGEGSGAGHTTNAIGGFFAGNYTVSGAIQYYYAPDGATSVTTDGSGTASSTARSGTIDRLGLGGSAGDNFIYFIAVFNRPMTQTEYNTINADPHSVFFGAPSLNVAGTAGAGTVGVAYTASFTASGGASPYTYSVGSGSLPAGVTLNTSTGALSGTPTTAGTSTFVIHAVDSTP